MHSSNQLENHLYLSILVPSFKTLILTKIALNLYRQWIFKLKILHL